MTMNDNELWSIALPGGEIRKGTLDQLDEAFNAGSITSTTPVLAPGASQWSTLGALAGLDDAAPHATVTQAPPTTFSPTTLRPVATDLSLDVDDPFLMPQKKSRVGIVIGMFVVMGVIAFGGYTFMRAGYLNDAPPPAAAAAALAPPATVAPPPPAPPPTPAPSASASAADEGKPKLTEDQKKALADADKKLADKAKSKKKDRAQHWAAPRRSGPAYDPIGAKAKGGKCGCNKGDPMCSCL